MPTISNETVQKLNDTLESLKINGKCLNAQQHRHLAFFDIKLEPGATVKKIESNVREIALGIQSKTIPFVKIIPEKGVIRLQVAMQEADTLYIKSLFKNIKHPDNMKLPFLFGETNEGGRLWVDIAKTPHLIVAGTTGSGKSVFLRTLISNAIYLPWRALDYYLIDPKHVEFRIFNTPVLKGLINYISFDYSSTISLLQFVHYKMESRYKLMSKYGCTDISETSLPYTIVIIDEVADLMQQQDKKMRQFENLLVKIAQKGRAAGVHLVLATQRPSKDVLTGLIKTNFPTRIACRVSSKIDSQVILDSPGAETLLGRGDAIIHNDSYQMTRFQVPYIEQKEIIDKYKIKKFSSALV